MIAATKRLISPEPKKFILPVLMCLILVTGIIGGLHLRGNGYDQKILEPTVNSVTVSQTFWLRQTYFPNQTDVTKAEIKTRMTQNDLQHQKTMDKLDIQTSLTTLYVIYNSNLFPLTPSRPIMMDTEPSATFTLNEGYILSKESVETLALISYRADAFQQLGDELNNPRENWTLKEFNTELEQIKSKNLNDREVRAAFADTNDNSSASLTMHGNLEDAEGLKAHVKNNSLKELQWFHFTPTLLATFIVYYILNSVLLSLFRNTRYLFRGYRLRRKTRNQTT